MLKFMLKSWTRILRLSPAILMLSLMGLAVAVAEDFGTGSSELSEPSPELTEEFQQEAPEAQVQALRELGDRHQCLPLNFFFDGSPEQNSITRLEFAEGLNLCLDRINDLIAQGNAQGVSQADLVLLQQLSQEFAPELASIRSRVDSLSASVEELEAEQFSPSDQLQGEVLFPLPDAMDAPPPYAPSTVAPPLGDIAVSEIAPAPIPAQPGGIVNNRASAQSNSNSFGLPTVGNAPADGLIVLDQSSPAFHQDLDREEYNPIFENPFLRVTDQPLSTFSIDVDVASYSNVRRFINSNQLPPVDAVRIEELINYFTYDYPDPDDDRPFSITTEVAEAPWNSQHKLVHIGLQGQRIETEDLPASNLVFLLDVSGSMDSPDKLPLLKSAFRLLVNELTEDDQVAIVVYAGAAGVVLPPTPGDEKETILAAIDNLQAGGSTAGGEGIQLAYTLAEEQFLESGNNRVILATDGDFNVGISSEAELVRLIEDKREQDIFLTVLGFGTGNLQDAKMEQMADHGNGNYAYIDNIREAQKVLVSELGATLVTIAKDVKIQVEFNPAKVQAYRLIGYENRLLRDQDFNDDTKDAGEMGAGHSVTALYEIIPVGVDLDVELPEIDDLRYQQVTVDPTTYAGNELLQVKLRYKEPTGDRSQLITQSLRDRSTRLRNTSDNFQFSAAVAAFGMMLRQSEYRGDVTPEAILDLARNSLGEDVGGYRSEFIRLVESYELLRLAQGN